MSVLETKAQGSQYVSVKLVPEMEGVRVDFRPGQFVKILTPALKKEGYFAIASEPEEKRYLEFLVKDHEEGPAHEFFRIQEGDTVRMSAALGKGYPLDLLKGKDVLLIGIGSALSPLRSLLKSMLRREREFGSLALIYGAKTFPDVPYPEDFEIWYKKIDLKLALSRPHRSEWSGFIGRVTALLPTLELKPENTIACICGTQTMEREVRAILEQAGFNGENILVNY